jgi:flagellar motility protein MotE (MotC chaperone)
VIVTRRRRKPFPWRRLLLPLVAIALVIFAFSWGPSRAVITGGPLGPMWNSAGNSFSTVAAPFHFAAQNQVIQQREHQIVQLQQQVAAAQAQAAAKDKQIASLNSQISQLQTQLATAHSATPAPAAAQNNTSAASGALPNASPAASENVQLSRTAQYWANMEPENAAKVVQKLPVPYVARVLAQMSPDAVGAILDALPASFAAQLTQENPELKR